jgi:hypothetical protein
MGNISAYDKAKIERRIELQLVDAGYVFSECKFANTMSFRGPQSMFILRTL